MHACTCIQSFIRALIHSFVRLSVRPTVHPSIHSFFRLFIHSFVLSFIHLSDNFLSLLITLLSSSVFSTADSSSLQKLAYVEYNEIMKSLDTNYLLASGFLMVVFCPEGMQYLFVRVVCLRLLETKPLN